MTGWAHYFSVYRLERTSHLCKLIKANLPEIVIMFRIKRRGSQSIVLGGGGGGALDAGDTWQ